MFIMEQKCILKESLWKVFDIFVDEPSRIHYIKEISRKISLAPTSVANHIKKLESYNLIIKKQGERFFGYIANRENPEFLFYKRISNLIKIKESGILDFLWDKLFPDVIILFGSCALGEDIEKSDIDLFIQSPEKRLNLKKYEKNLGKEINLFYETNFSRLSKELKNNILNGIVLKGYLKVF